MLSEVEGEKINNVVDFTPTTRIIEKILVEEPHDSEITSIEGLFGTSYSQGLTSISESLTEKVGDILQRVLNPLPFFTISATRGSQQRLYRTTELKSHMEESLSILIRIQYRKEQSKLDFIDKWIREFGIGSKLRAKIIDGDYAKGYVLEEKLSTTGEVDSAKDLEEISIADLGLGVTQLIPIVIFTANALNSSSIICIEEPGIHMHPDLQSKLVDFVEDAISHGVQILFETHSEYFIRKLQYLVGKRKSLRSSITSNKIGLYYLSRGSKKEIEISEDGSLPDQFENDYGKHFLGESTIWVQKRVEERLQMELDSVGGKDVPTVFVEGQTDKEILELAIQLFAEKQNVCFDVKAKNSSGGNWVKDMVFAWIASNRNSRVIAMLDGDVKGKEIFHDLNMKIEKNYPRRIEKVKIIRLDIYKHEPLRRLYGAGVKVDIDLERMYSKKIWEKVKNRGWLNMDELSIQIPTKNLFDKSAMEWIKSKTDDCPSDALYLHPIKMGKKREIVKLIKKLPESEKSEALSAFKPIVKDLIKFLA